MIKSCVVERTKIKVFLRKTAKDGSAYYTREFLSVSKDYPACNAMLKGLPGFFKQSAEWMLDVGKYKNIDPPVQVFCNKISRWYYFLLEGFWRGSQISAAEQFGDFHVYFYLHVLYFL